MSILLEVFFHESLKYLDTINCWQLTIESYEMHEFRLKKRGKEMRGELVEEVRRYTKMEKAK